MKIPAWLGMVIGVAIGIVAIIIGLVSGPTGFVPLGIWAIVASIIGYATGSAAAVRARGQGRPLDLHMDVVWSHVPNVAWLVIAGLFVIAVVIAFVV